ncbi:TPA: hypothetical protein QDB11_000570 [Burkholderia vietnamiensis]|uniref:hypothetical protein n=1 Tax=Burkholderia vietnamiensis TaxID=60552 RepID=UPI00264E1405|nr:hypothetical protein [Burkholderia vietnamiensis]MDN8111265.1 hypothetical protein [Burkholderia vietnamiensis]HDR9135963.1 hypothetical protein [Burkholderia vietnamiensis]
MKKENNETDMRMTLDGAVALSQALKEVMKQFPKEAQESLADYMEFRRRLRAESDRGCALVGAAYLDDEITKLLRARMVNNKRNTDALLEQGRAVSAFSAKIRVAYAMGLIPDDVLHDINIIRDIRNKFAHLHGALSFDDESIGDQCRALRIALKSKRESSPRSRFIHVVTTVYTALSIESRKPRAQVPSADVLYQLLEESERTLDYARDVPIAPPRSDEAPSIAQGEGHDDAPSSE